MSDPPGWDFGGSDEESHYAAPAFWAEWKKEREAMGLSPFDPNYDKIEPFKKETKKMGHHHDDNLGKKETIGADNGWGELGKTAPTARRPRKRKEVFTPDDIQAALIAFYDLPPDAAVVFILTDVGDQFDRDTKTVLGGAEATYTR